MTKQQKKKRTDTEERDDTGANIQVGLLMKYDVLYVRYVASDYLASNCIRQWMLTVFLLSILLHGNATGVHFPCQNRINQLSAH